MLPDTALTRRARSDGSRPLITWYGTAGRTELSGVTFDNWVSKAASFIRDELDLDAEPVAMPLLDSHPGHWMTLVWVAGLWRAGCWPADGGRVAVAGPDGDGGADAEQVAAVSLHPFGLPLGAATPPGAIDWNAEVRAQPDAFAGLAPDPLSPAWQRDGVDLDQATLGARPGSGLRTLVQPSAPLDTVLVALVDPLLGGGSSVVVEAGEIDRIAADEQTSR